MTEQAQQPTQTDSQATEAICTPGTGATELTCSPDDLRRLFLFAKLSDEQLDWLCQHGHVERFEPGFLYREGDPATCFYVLLKGTCSPALGSQRRPARRARGPPAQTPPARSRAAGGASARRGQAGCRRRSGGSSR